MPVSTAQLSRIRTAFFGPIDQYLAWHDGFEVDATTLAGLDAAGRTQVGEEFMQALRADRADARPLMGLGYLHYEPALPLLHECVRQRRYPLYALQAVAAISPAGLSQPLLLAALNAQQEWTALLDVLIGLRAFPVAALTPLLPPRLLALLAHPDYLARYHALGTLRALYPLPAPAHPADSLFELISADGRPARYREAQRQLLAQLPPATAAALRAELG